MGSGVLTKLKREIARHKSLAPLYRLYKRSKIVRWLPYDNLFHCCTQKTASQWFRAVFNDPAFYAYTGFEIEPYRELGLRQATFDRPFPKRKVVTALYISHPTFLSITKPYPYKAFFVLRDPRDTVVSWYFHGKNSDSQIPPMPELRRELNQLSLHAGLKYMIDRLEEFGSFEAQRSWILEQDADAPKIFRYEDLSRDNPGFLKLLFQYLGVDMPESEFTALVQRHTFKKHSGGREQGQEDQYAHSRKGIAGDWENYFDAGVLEHFRSVTGDTLEILGYADQ
ncbi:MAG: sulfotransferase domain-containing protein [Gemmatimonadota bacterium]|nr:MAG: sulfotransferase domain-containing protein [Gemmatimonadota bacterium]